MPQCKRSTVRRTITHTSTASRNPRDRLSMTLGLHTTLATHVSTWHGIAPLASHRIGRTAATVAWRMGRMCVHRELSRWAERMHSELSRWAERMRSELSRWAEHTH